MVDLYYSFISSIKQANAFIVICALIFSYKTIPKKQKGEYDNNKGILIINKTFI